MEKKYKIGYTSGVFDMFHVGHLNILKKAKEMCDFLVVGVTSDNLCFQRKNKYPIINENDRIEIVSAIKYVDQVVVQDDMDKFKMVQNIKANVVFVGSDWKGSDSWNKYEKEFEKINVDVVYFDYTTGISSTILRDKLNNL